jgi:hypothetical protein
MLSSCQLLDPPLDGPVGCGAGCLSCVTLMVTILLPSGVDSFMNLGAGAEAHGEEGLASSD